jgi:hypothetical protein
MYSKHHMRFNDGDGDLDPTTSDIQWDQDFDGSLAQNYEGSNAPKLDGRTCVKMTK